jgi:hypothetical protein
MPFDHFDFQFVMLAFRQPLIIVVGGVGYCVLAARLYRERKSIRGRHAASIASISLGFAFISECIDRSQVAFLVLFVLSAVFGLVSVAVRIPKFRPKH